MGQGWVWMCGQRDADPQYRVSTAEQGGDQSLAQGSQRAPRAAAAEGVGQTLLWLGRACPRLGLAAVPGLCSCLAPAGHAGMRGSVGHMSCLPGTVPGRPARGRSQLSAPSQERAGSWLHSTQWRAIEKSLEGFHWKKKKKKRKGFSENLFSQTGFPGTRLGLGTRQAGTGGSRGSWPWHSYGTHTQGQAAPYSKDRDTGPQDSLLCLLLICIYFFIKCK